MFCALLRDLLRTQPSRRAAVRPPPARVPAEAPRQAPVQAPPLGWTAERLAINDQLWGFSFIQPGGETEVVQLARPLGLSSAGTLLLVGVGSGGPAQAVARNLGAYVDGQESDPNLLAAAQSRLVPDRFGKRVALNAWNPASPDFARFGYNHCLALEPLRHGPAEPILHGLAQAIRAGGSLVVSASAAAMPLDPDDEVVAKWAALDGRNPKLIPTDRAVTRMLGRLGFDVRIEEDITHRHLEHALLGWRLLLTGLQQGTPDRNFARQLTKEAELWLLRRRLLREGRLRMMRWHGISRQAAVA